ncbi:hypothetical protein TNCV_4276411 [Trichonephila clavipes]|nr:hypothetical protein TNCV_4276411 [Trichonephila clavipes]
MITNFFIPELNNHDVQELWFQQDGATCHTARATIDLLKDTFGDRLISRFGPVNWPPRSCDLTPLDYFLWGYVNFSNVHYVQILICNLQAINIPILRLDGRHAKKFGKQFVALRRLGGVVGLSLAFCTKGCGFDPGPSR